MTVSEMLEKRVKVSEYVCVYVCVKRKREGEREEGRKSSALDVKRAALRSLPTGIIDTHAFIPKKSPNYINIHYNFQEILGWPSSFH